MLCRQNVQKQTPEKEMDPDLLNELMPGISPMQVKQYNQSIFVKSHNICCLIFPALMWTDL